MKIEDFLLVIVLALVALVALALISLPSFLAFIVYRSVKHKGQAAKIAGMALVSLTVLATLYGLFRILFGPSGYGPDYDKAEIRQNIGGTLICRSVFTADIHDWQHDVTYYYKPADSSRAAYIGTGTYYTRPWDKDEQLIRYRNWLILKTGGMGDFDRIIIGDARSNQWKEYDLSEETIVSDPLWKRLNHQPRVERCCSESFVTKIENGSIHVHYKFRVDGLWPKSYGRSDIVYTIDEQTGQPIMTGVR